MRSEEGGGELVVVVGPPAAPVQSVGVGDEPLLVVDAPGFYTTQWDVNIGCARVLAFRLRYDRARCWGAGGPRHPTSARHGG